MKLIIAGSRHFPSLGITEQNHWYSDKHVKIYNLLEEMVKDLEVTHVISGRCWGMDQLGERWAKANNKELLLFPADWKKYGKAAGPIRNKEMAVAGDALVCICTSDSRGSNNMIDNMKKLGKPYWFEYIE